MMMSVWINGHCIDGSGSLPHESIADWSLPSDLTSDEADAINEAISAWEVEDPDGYDDAAARCLDDRVAKAVERHGEET